MKAILKKELLEWFNAGTVGRWGRYEFLVVIALIGVVLPLLIAPRNLGEILCMYAGIFPVMLIAGAMADSIAGERERGTLQTLFLFPVTDSDIILGKVGGALCYALLLCLGGLLAGTATLLIRGGAPAPTWEYLASVLGCALFSLLLGLLVAWLALGNVTARQAQTYAYLPFYALIVVALLLPKLGVQVLPPSVVASLPGAFMMHPVLFLMAAAALLFGLSVLSFALCRQRLRSVRCAR